MVFAEATATGDLLPHAALIGGIIGTIVGCIQLIFGILKQRREDKVSRAKFGYELIDAILANQFVLNLLEGIDALPPNINDIEKVLDSSLSNLSEELQGVQKGLDWLLLDLDRVEHALSADLTDFEVIESH
jgi:hypothetical protein